ncbi:MAG TPA: hypothetical protein VF463_10040 [Sphingobium sp.]
MRLSWTLMMLPVLASCGQANERICETPIASPAVGDWQGCVHRWAYRLASAPGSSAQVAQAVVAGCEDAVYASIKPDDNNGHPGELMADLLATAQRQALFRVTQARAGHCGAV